MFQKMLYAVVIAIAAFVVGGLFLPNEVHVERTIHVDRPAATVFTLLNGFRTFSEWSPWLERDPDAAYRFSGPEEGVGAHMSWSGDPRMVGNGWQEITGSEPNRRVALHMSFENQGDADTSFEIVRAPGGGVTLTWTFDADLSRGQGWLSGLLARYFGLFFDSWIGSDYERGLERFKTFAESFPPADFAGLDVSIVDAKPMDVLYIAVDAGSATEDVAASLAAAYGRITAFMQARGIDRLAPPLAITRAWAPVGYEFDAAIPVVAPEDPAVLSIEPGPQEVTPENAEAQRLSDSNEAEETDTQQGTSESNEFRDIRFGHSPSGRAVRVVHRGPYAEMAPTYARLAAWMAVHGMTEGHVSWEQYVSDPAETDPDDLLTYIYFLVGEGAED
ncbi:MAG: SRPBCC family protein [Lysobacterales bacterium]|jgi:effector-binding domain-containing protein